jgi:hypothetical protein
VILIWYKVGFQIFASSMLDLTRVGYLSFHVADRQVELSNFLHTDDLRDNFFVL